MIKNEWRKDQSMKLITVHIPHYLLDEILRLTDMLVFPNRSEAIRAFIRDGIIREYELDTKIKSRSRCFDFFKEYISHKQFVKHEEIVIAYLDGVLGISKKINPTLTKSLKQIFSKFCTKFVNRGYFERINESVPYTYKIINRGWNHD